MNKNKTLIYMNINMLEPKGGPFGYLYNLKKGLDEINANDIEFLNYPIYTKKENKIFLKLKNIYNKFPNYIKNRYNDLQAIKYYKSIMEEKYDITKIDSYKYIHFHSTMDLYKARETLLNYKGKVLLTSHSPKPTYLEKTDDFINKHTLNSVKRMYSNIEQVDEYAFNRADYIVFPCEEAEEPYYNQWDKYKSIKEKNKEKYRYIPTGIIECKAKKSKSEIREKYNIPKDAFLISYVGRHNEVKGYDRLKQIATEILKSTNDIYFIIAGKEGPLYKLEDEKWIEVGWTNDPHSIISASDLFILPNRETYFDLIMLEVMSLRIPILASYTGGNKYFKKYENLGIEFFNDEKEAIDKIINFFKLSNNEIEKFGKENRKIYEQDFNEEKFAENYVKLIKSLKGD